MNFSYSNLYLDYLSIEHTSYYEKINFYKKYSERLDLLSFHQRVEIKVDYILCLFEVGSYYNFLNEVDYLIETVVIENMQKLNGKDVFYELLLRKAASLYNIGQTTKALAISRQLLNIHNNPSTRLLYHRCRSKILRKQLDWLRGIVMVALLSGISLTFVNLLYFEPFYPEASRLLVTARNVLMWISLSGLFVYEFYIRFTVYKEMHGDSIIQASKSVVSRVIKAIKAE